MMRKLCSYALPFALLFAAMTAGSAAGLRAQSVQLADGKVVLATVEEHDGDGLRVRRLDNGGMLDLRWDQLSTASATALKKKFDLLGDTEDEVFVRAEEVEYTQKGTRQVVVGRIVDPSADPLVVQAKGVTYPIPRRDLGPVRKVEVPATQVYTKEEFYVMRRDEVAPGDSADKHMLLAEDLIKFRDYDRAAEHLERSKQLGNSKDQKKLDGLVDRLKRFKEAAKELGMLEQIQAARSRGKLKDFEKGRELIAEFQKQFPTSKLKAEFDRETQRFEQARTRYLTQRVADQWRRNIQSIAEKKEGEDGFTLQAARDYAEDKMTEDIVAKLEGQLGIEADEIKAMWADRAKFPLGKRSEHFNYGIGSWVLGDKAIVKDTSVGKALDKQAGGAQQPAAGQDREIERFAKLLRQAMERRREASQGGQEQREQTDEGWWTDASRGERVSWLKAYYAEFGGQLVVTYASASPCISCYGEGTTLGFGNDGRPERSKCFLCQGTKWLRSFKAY